MPAVAPPSPVGRAFGIVLVVASIIVAVITFSGAAAATGLFGTQGKLTVDKCVPKYGKGSAGGGVHSGSKVLKGAKCTGSFRSSDGNVVDRNAEITLSGRADDDAINRVVREKAADLEVNRASDGELSVTSLVSVANYLCVGFFFVTVLGYGLTCAVAGSFPKKGVGPSRREAEQLLPRPVKATEEWLWVIGGLGLLGSIIFRIVLW
ncbi:hypothetical protein ACOKM3_13565 [Streptomyces sp. BH106]|uniref:hypothetical protein n=1 Tax=Streptomyces sp. BH106 TaxID=3410409 RepID=UPI003CED7CCC